MHPSTIAFPENLNALLKEFLSNRNYSQVGLLMDENTKKLCYSLILDGLPEHQLMEIKAGEGHKNIETCIQVWQQLTEFGFDRHSLLIILGGGVVGDLGGFCASTFKRGIDFLLLPTTLLSQVDSSIGGKLGIDFQNYKNHIGVFQEPVGTFISTLFLKTLPERELRSGFAEVVKHCLISDTAMWNKVRSKSLSDQHWEELIRHSVAFKHSVIERDPKENGLRKILNFGHSIGHSVEGHFLATTKPIFHGEAVAIGMIAEAFIGFKKGLLTDSELSQITRYLVHIFGHIELPANEKDLLERIKQDKKNLGNRILIALPQGIGKAVWDVGVSEDEIVQSLDFYRSL